MAKNPPAKAGKEKGMATHSSILAWGISWTEKPRDYGPQVPKSQTQLK